MIITDEKALRVKCEDVKPEEFEPLRLKLEQALKHSYEMGRPGIGLAAPQIGIAKNIAIVRLVTRSGDVTNIDLVNCKIKKAYDKEVFKNEGCLSLPGIYCDVMRYNEVYVVNNLVEPYSFVTTGVIAACVQHEIDHLNGILFTDLQAVV
jgi:peptide deformylase